MDKENKQFAFEKMNYTLLLIGLGINIIGFILMIGGKSPDPAKFDAKELFSPVRITIAPIFIVLGYLVIIFSIMKKPKSVESSSLQTPVKNTKSTLES
jgi:hypothetical protein